MIRTFVISFLLTIGLSEFQFRQARAQVTWKHIETPKAQPSPVIWETTISDSEKPDETTVKWKAVSESEDQNQLPSMV